MSNDNSIAAISGFTVDDGPYAGFQAANGSAMSGVNATDGSFAAYCTFYVRGDVSQFPTALPTDGAGFLWGTTLGNAGWGLLLSSANNILQLSASMGEGGSITTLDFPLTATDDGAGNHVSLVERLIMAGLWFDGDTMHLSVNGNLVTPGATITTYSPGAAPARLGIDPNGALPAAYVDILGAGYFNGIPLSSSNRLASQIAGLSFRSAREAFGSGLILPDNGKDWTHRYWAKSLASGNAPAAANINKNSIGVSITAPASARAVLPDIGQSGSQDTPTGLTQLNPGTLPLFLTSQKNPDWYHGGGITSVAPEG